VRSIAIALLLLLAGAAGADEPPVPLKKLVARCDAVIVGTLGEVQERSDRGVDSGAGILTVERVLSGRLEPGDRLPLRWSGGGIAGTGLGRAERAGDRRIWLLRFDPDGTVRADPFHRSVDVERLPEVTEHLAASTGRTPPEYVPAEEKALYTSLWALGGLAVLVIGFTLLWIRVTVRGTAEA
jgi:hypothetical protein